MTKLVLISGLSDMQFLKTLCVGVKLTWLQFLVAFSCTYEILKEKSENKITLYTIGKYMQTFLLYHSTMTYGVHIMTSNTVKLSCHKIINCF